MKTKWIWAASLLAMMSAVACRCGGCGESDTREVDALPASAEEIFKLLFASRKKAKVDAPLEAVPRDLDLIAASPDPEAWRAWAVQQPYTKRLMETPLFRELRMSRGYLALDGLQHQAAQAASLTGTRDDRAALWKGPTAAGLRFSAEGSPSVLLVKTIDKSAGAVLRFAAAFAMLSQKPLPEGAKKEVSGVEVRSLAFRDETILYAVFENLLIAGNDAALVESAIALAMKDGDDPASEDPLFSAATAPGIHLRANAPAGSVLRWFGLSDVGVSLLADAQAPAIVRKLAPEKAAGSAALLRYAPEGAFFAMAADASPTRALLSAEQDQPDPSLTIDRKQIAALVDGGVAVILGSSPSGEALATPAGLIAVANRTDPAQLEPKIRELLAQATGKKPSRSVLEPYGGAILLDAGGPSAAITKDALLFALDPERLRSALAAGTGKAPSLADRKGVDLGGSAGGVYFDLDRAGSFLNAFYARTLEGDGEAPWSEAQQVLGPTFAALGSGGAGFAKMESKDETAEGTIRVLP